MQKIEQGVPAPALLRTLQPLLQLLQPPSSFLLLAAARLGRRLTGSRHLRRGNNQAISKL
jgi:hypothetical protein